MRCVDSSQTVSVDSVIFFFFLLLFSFFFQHKRHSTEVPDDDKGGSNVDEDDGCGPSDELMTDVALELTFCVVELSICAGDTPGGVLSLANALAKKSCTG